MPTHLSYFIRSINGNDDVVIHDSHLSYFIRSINGNDDVVIHAYSLVVFYSEY